MRRVIQREITTIKIVSVKLTWADEPDPVVLDAVEKKLPAPEEEPAPQVDLTRPKKIYPKVKSKPAEQPEAEN
jgi:hypothetical protein